jgi:hypothetical protein
MAKLDAARPEATSGRGGAPKVAVPGKKYKKRVYVHRETIEIIDAIEKRNGENTSAFEAMFLVKMLRSKDLTIEALKTHVQKLGREKAELAQRRRSE